MLNRLEQFRSSMTKIQGQDMKCSDFLNLLEEACEMGISEPTIRSLFQKVESEKQILNDMVQKQTEEEAELSSFLHQCIPDSRTCTIMISFYLKNHSLESIGKQCGLSVRYIKKLKQDGIDLLPKMVTV